MAVEAGGPLEKWRAHSLSPEFHSQTYSQQKRVPVSLLWMCERISVEASVTRAPGCSPLNYPAVRWVNKPTVTASYDVCDTATEWASLQKKPEPEGHTWHDSIYQKLDRGRLWVLHFCECMSDSNKTLGKDEKWDPALYTKLVRKNMRSTYAFNH